MNPYQRVLVLETSSRIGQVALGEENRIVASRALAQAYRHATDLAVVVETLLRQTGLTCRDLTAIVVGLGPGSYTGLRVGLMAAKTLSYALGIPLAGISTFSAIARQSPAEAQTVEVIADGLQRTVFSQRFQRGEDRVLEPMSAIRACSIEEWRAACAADAVIIGPGAGVYASEVPGTCRIIGEGFEASLPGGLLEEAVRGQRQSVDPWLLEPIYVRGSSAEEKRKKDEVKG